MHAAFPRSSSLILLLACACGSADDAGAERSTLEEPATGSDAAAKPASPSAPVDAGGSTSPSTPPSTPPPTLADALNPEGVHTDVLRAKLVVEEACRKLVACGSAGASEPQCVDTTLSDWSLNALFFAEPCLDAQLDLYACYARVGCETQSGCAEPQALQETLCSAEQ